MQENRKKKIRRERKRMKPHLELYSHLEEGRIPSAVMGSLSLAVNNCLPAVLALPEGPVPVLSGLEEVEISIVDDDSIRDVHARFLDDPSETDVITFPHGDGLGEIVVSYDTAVRQAVEYQRTRLPGTLPVHGAWPVASARLHRHGARGKRADVLPSGILWWENSDRNLRACLFRIMPER